MLTSFFLLHQALSPLSLQPFNFVFSFVLFRLSSFLSSFMSHNVSGWMLSQAHKHLVSSYKVSKCILVIGSTSHVVQSESSTLSAIFLILPLLVVQICFKVNCRSLCLVSESYSLVQFGAILRTLCPFYQARVITVRTCPSIFIRLENYLSRLY